MAETEKQEGVRERLLAEALTLFNKKGYAATSVREIVEGSGVTKPVLYYYFGSKEGIYLELMQSSFDKFDQSIAGMTAIAGTAEDRIVHFCSMILDLVVEHLEVVRLIYAIFYGPPQGAPAINFEDYFTRIVETIQRLIDEGIAGRELKTDDSRGAAWTLVSILNTAMEEQLCQSPPRVDARLMERMLRLVLQGLKQ